MPQTSLKTKEEEMLTIVVGILEKVRMMLLLQKKSGPYICEIQSPTTPKPRPAKCSYPYARTIMSNSQQTPVPPFTAFPPVSTYTPPIQDTTQVQTQAQQTVQQPASQSATPAPTATAIASTSTSTPNATTQQPQQSRQAAEEARKDRTLADFMLMLDEYEPLVRHL